MLSYHNNPRSQRGEYLEPESYSSPKKKNQTEFSTIVKLYGIRNLTATRRSINSSKSVVILFRSLDHFF